MTTPHLPILTVTLNPALDMSTSVPQVTPGPKLRCTEPMLDPGGGGLNVSRAIAALGGDSLELVALGGITGDRLATMLQAENIRFLALRSPGETRLSITVDETGTGRQFRFVLPGPVWETQHQAQVFDALESLAKPGWFGVISGSQMPGVPTDFYTLLTKVMPDMQIILDTSGPALEQACAVPIPGPS
ncbi:MAG: PfkB family carbohydrate kinase, partial [Paracoccaceae bacterium]|nr:PfkB family carbohydrate kinase [Paracoccaceae bacterium]